MEAAVVIIGIGAAMGLADCFAHFGAKGRNQRWSWSARSDDGKVVVMTLWKDLLDYKSNPISYSTFGRSHPLDRIDKPGNHERLENLQWALAHCDGIFRVVITVAEDINASPRKIAHCYPHDRMVMKLLDLNVETGEFRAINVGA